MRSRWYRAAFLFAGAVVASSRAAGDEEEMKIFDADLGRAWIDVSAYPPEQQRAYALFAQKCSKCHTLARPINSSLSGDDWLAYVARMSRKPGSGISPGDGEEITAFLLFDSERRERSANAVDPELLPFLAVSGELAGVRRFPASTQDLRFLDGELRIDVEGDRRLDLGRLIALDEGQDLVRWTRRAPNEGQIVLRETPFRGEDGPAAELPPAGAALKAVVAEAVGAEGDPTERVELILDWLDANVVREAREGTPSVDAILSDRRGDATEHTALFAAMVNAAGIPVRTRVGLLPRRTALCVHPWAEVLLGE
ncbi:MAG TPA: transglutaminase-like domain-containing protein, partial [bacterium]|nr:transglutaminase-like domain-containing protein [bacterium]